MRQPALLEMPKGDVVEAVREEIRAYYQATGLAPNVLSVTPEVCSGLKRYFGMSWFMTPEPICICGLRINIIDKEIYNAPTEP